MYGYYRFVETYHREPVDAEDLFDGLRNIAANNAVMEALISDG